MDLNVTLTLSDRLFDLLEDKLPSIERRVRRAMKKEVGAQVNNELEISITATPTQTEAPAESTSAPSAETPAETPAAVKETAEKATAKAAAKEIEAEAEPQFPTLPDCRAALERARLRIEGENHKDKKGEAYERYHKAISAIVKQTVMQVSGGKAKVIPQLAPEMRARFIAEMDALKVDENGDLQTMAPPF